ncbi:hypothetical protein EI94DRAFT_1120417 [Lactarius quietus]|nr:hypothetical protein EI94DRAFT_1120417 [Lactarius quietus]
MSYDLYEEGFLSPSSSTLKRSPPSKHTLSRNRSTTSLRGGTSSLAHELAVALLPEPTAGSKLLAEEFGIEYDDGAEGIDGMGIDGMPPHEDNVPTFAVAVPSDLDPSITLDSAASGSSTPGVTDDDDILDPTFHSPSPRTPARSQPELDAMALLSQNLESTEQFLAHLRRLDTDGPAPLALEALTADIIGRLNETARDREEQVRELLKCEREFQRIAAEVGGADALAGLDALVVEAASSPSSSSPVSVSASAPPALDPVAEEPSSFSHEWDDDPDAHLLHHSHSDGSESDEEDVDVDVDVHGGSSDDGSPLKDTFPVSPPPPLSASGTTAAPASPSGAIPHLAHLRTHTASLVSSLMALSEHAQVNGAATTDAGRKIRM